METDYSENSQDGKVISQFIVKEFYIITFDKDPLKNYDPLTKINEIINGNDEDPQSGRVILSPSESTLIMASYRNINWYKKFKEVLGTDGIFNLRLTIFPIGKNLNKGFFGNLEAKSIKDKKTFEVYSKNAFKVPIQD